MYSGEQSAIATRAYGFFTKAARACFVDCEASEIPRNEQVPSTLSEGFRSETGEMSPAVTIIFATWLAWRR